MQLDAELVMELEVEVGETQEVGKTNEGYLRLIPITGGTFSGKKLSGKVLPGGYDWNVAINDSLAHVFAKYAIQTDDGEIISIENEGYIGEGNNVIKTTPRFQASNGKYAYLNSGVFVGSLEGSTKGVPGVIIKIYKLL